ncbi:MAG: GcrA cell cycle regulator [Rhizobiaceae bacterium]|nr:GcrA cell cycle regulator [Rhizobiaceae bacterium]
MSWTEDRVARLTKLWADGLSASQVAADLGGITRNAVIGKIHRLGLSGRVKPASKGGGRPKRQARPNGYSRTNRTTPKIARARYGAGSVKEAAYVAPNEDLVAPESKRIKLVELNETTCKWPEGDPQDRDFSFCGHSVKTDTPYCEFHCKMAYQPPVDRRRPRKSG